VVALLIVASGCGGSSTVESTAASDTGTSGVTPAVAAKALVDRWGNDRDAFYVVVWSLDRGYSAEQIIDAAPASLIRADGAILDADGRTMEAEREPAGLLAGVSGEALGPGVVVAAISPVGGLTAFLLADERPQDAEVSAVGLLSEVFDGGLAAWREKEDGLGAQAEGTGQDLSLDNATAITWITLGLGARGYSTEQILEAILLGNWDVYRSEDLNYCWRVFSSKGTEILPEYGSADVLLELECAAEAEQRETDEASTTISTTTTTTTTTTEAPLAFPRTYVGGGSTTWSMSWWSAGSCTVEGETLELTLQADGTVSGTYQQIARSFQRVEQGPFTCSDDIFVNDLELTGSHTPPAPGTSEHGDVSVEIVGWSDWHIQGKYTPSEMSFVSEIQYEATGYEGDEPNPRVIRVVDYTLLFADEG
jgi:hypothetical protein